MVEFFAKNILTIFKDFNVNPRVYVYSSKKISNKKLLGFHTNYYIDKRAKKPYYIFRVASVRLVRQWKALVENTKNNEKLYPCILRGFFAGEGNLKEGKNSNRTIRIAQGKPNKFIEKILKYHGIKYRYEHHGRAYTITGKWNWDKFAQIKLADLHPTKKEKFWRIYNSYKEIHYPHHTLKNSVLKILYKPYTAVELAIMFERTPARIRDILIALKKESILQDFRVRSTSYWIKTDREMTIISKVKGKYLKSLKRKEKTTGELAEEMDVCWKSAYRRLAELQKLNLVVKDSKNVWKTIPKKEKVIVL